MIESLLKQHYALDNIQLKDKLIQSGGGNSYYNYINLIIGIVLIVIGYLVANSNYYTEKTTGLIKEIESNGYNKTVLVNYKVKDQEFSRYLVTPIDSEYKPNSQIDIIYDIYNPNLIRINTINTKIIGSVLVLIGIYMVVIN